MDEEHMKMFEIMKNFINKHKKFKDSESEFRTALICGLYLNADLE